MAIVLSAVLIIAVRETATNDIKYLCEMAIDRLLWLNDDKDGNLSHTELEADERLAEFLGSGKIIAVPNFNLLLEVISAASLSWSALMKSSEASSLPKPR